MAIVLAEYARQHGTFPWQIEASDISTRVLARAQQGIYPAERVKLPQLDLLPRYFQKGVGANAGFYRVKEALRQAVRFHQLNPLQAQYPVASSQQGQPPEPRSLTLEIVAADPGRVEWTMTEMDPKAQPRVLSFSGTGDGRPGPVKGSDMNTTAGFTVKGGVMTAVFSTPDGGSDHLSCSLAPNGAQMTCRGTETDGRGHRDDYVDIYDRR